MLERVIQVQDRILDTQEQQQGQIQILLDAAIRHEERIAEHNTRIARQDALIERLDAIIERMIYREGRNGEGGLPNQE